MLLNLEPLPPIVRHQVTNRSRAADKDTTVVRSHAGLSGRPYEEIDSGIGGDIGMGVDRICSRRWNAHHTAPGA